MAWFRDPFRRGDNVLVLCECITGDGKVVPSNTRAAAVRIFDACKDAEPWFGIEQEYMLFDRSTLLCAFRDFVLSLLKLVLCAADCVTPLGWPQYG